MKTKITVTYKAPLNSKVDKKITKKLESIGAEWYAQGTNEYEETREICFDLHIKGFDKPRFVQTRNPRHGNYVKIDRKKGMIVDSSKKKFKGIKLLK